MTKTEKNFWEFIRNKGYLSYSRWYDTGFKYLMDHTDNEVILFYKQYISYFIWRSKGKGVEPPIDAPVGKYWCRYCQTLRDDKDRAPRGPKTVGKINWCYTCYSKYRGLKQSFTQTCFERVSRSTATPWEIRKRELYLKWLRNRKDRNRINRDPAYKLSKRLRTQISLACGGNKKWPDKSNAIIGLSYSDFMPYLESYFDSYMTWDNYGSYWHVHHIIPLDTYAGNFPMIKKLFYYKNLIPLSASDNLSIHTSIVPSMLTSWHHDNFDTKDLIYKFGK